MRANPLEWPLQFDYAGQAEYGGPHPGTDQNTGEQASTRPVARSGRFYELLAIIRIGRERMLYVSSTTVRQRLNMAGHVAILVRA